MVKHFCDRCNKVIANVRTYNTLYVSDDAGNELVLEICDECQDELGKWWNSKNEEQ